MIITEETTIQGTLDMVWQVSTDVDNWSQWDPHEEVAKLYGPFAVGTKGWSKPRGGPAANWVLTHIDDKKSWSLSNVMSYGALNVTNVYSQLPDGTVLCQKTMVVSGPLVILFWLHFAKQVRKDMQVTWKALEKRVAN